jgi:hypothetical protein
MEIMAREKWRLLAVPNIAIYTADAWQKLLMSLRLECSE